MRVTEGEIVRGGLRYADACLVIGDGGREMRVFRIIAEAYNHSKTVLAPVLPSHERLGLDGVAKALTTLVSRQPIREYTYLVLIDLEHVESLGKVEDKLRERGFKVLEAKTLGEGCYRIQAKRGGKAATIHLAVLGDRRCRSIEAHISKMIRELYGEEVGCDKVNRWLRERGMRDSELVREVTEKGLVPRTLPQLATILQQLIKDPRWEA